MQKLLTDTYLRSLAPPASGRVEIGDTKCGGLAFRVTANGARSWCFRFTDPDTRRDARLTLGAYPDVGLGKARELADVHRAAVARGENPIADRRKARAGAETATFAYLAARYMVEWAERRKKSHAADARNLRLHVLPRWKSRAYATISRADVVELLERLITAGKPTLCNRVQELISKVFSFAVDAGLLTASPCYRLKRRGVERVGRRVLSDGEIRLFWHGIVARSRHTGLALQLALLTGARVGEIAGICRAELEHVQDDERACWILPPERTKAGRAHIIPLSPTVRQIVLELLGQLGKGGRYLLPSRARTDKPIDGTTLSSAAARFKIEGDGEAERSWRAERPSAHDLRRTFATRMAGLGVSQEIRDRLLNHAPRSIEGRHYNAHDYLAERRRALAQWDAALAGILSTHPADVVPIGTARKRARA